MTTELSPAGLVICLGIFVYCRLYAMNTVKIVLLFSVFSLLAFSLVFVFGTRFFIDRPPQELDKPRAEEAPIPWTVDLSAAGFGVINFVYGGGDEWHPDSYFISIPPTDQEASICKLIYNPASSTGHFLQKTLCPRSNLGLRTT